MITLGSELKDKITGYQGIATSEHKYLTGCTQYGLQARVNDKGDIPDIKYFDEGRLIIIGTGINASDVASETDGCDYREHP